MDAFKRRRLDGGDDSDSNSNSDSDSDSSEASPAIPALVSLFSFDLDAFKRRRLHGGDDDDSDSDSDSDSSKASPAIPALASLFSFDLDAFKRRRLHGGDDDDSDSGSDSSEASPAIPALASLFSFDLDAVAEDDDQKWVRVDDPAQQKSVLPGPDEAKSKSGGDKRARRPPAAAAAAGGNSGGSPRPVEPVGGSTRRLWVKDRKKEWWDNLNRPDVPDEEFRAAFRMSRATFDMICDELDAAFTKKSTVLREAVPVRQRVAVCIWRLATGEPLRLVSNRFGLGISTCHKLVLEVCAAIKDVLMPKFLKWPDEPQMGHIKRRFESLSGIPNVAGSMYTTHVPIIAPKISTASYYNKRHTERNQRTSYSITVQGVVDDRGVFTDICIGWPGSMTGVKVLEKSALYQRASQGLLRDLWIVGNSGHPLTDWVLVPYTQKKLTPAQSGFNERIEAVQRVAREAFARLKERWACLCKRTEVKLHDLPVVVGACYTLHNICEAREEAVPEAERFELFDREIVVEKPVRSAKARQARDHIADDLLRRGVARPSVGGLSTHSRWSSAVDALGQGQVLILFSRGSSEHRVVARLGGGVGQRGPGMTETGCSPAIFGGRDDKAGDGGPGGRG